MALVLGLLACGASPERPVLTVGTRSVPLKELESGFWAFTASDSTARPDTVSLHRYVRSLADKILTETLAEETITELEPARADRVLEFSEQSYVEALRKEAYGSAYQVSDRDLKAAWEKLGRRLHLRYMLVGTQQEAREIRAALEQGAVFAKIAQQKSLDPSTREKGGDIGFISYLDLDPLTRDDIFSLPVGGISEPIVWGEGYQIFQVVEEQSNEGRGTIQEERRRLEQGVVTKSVRTAKARFEEQLLEKYHYQMDPAQVAWMTVLLREKTKGINRGEDLQALGAQEDGSAVAASDPVPWTGLPVPLADTSRVLATFDPPKGRVTPLMIFDQLFSHPMPTWPRFESGTDVENLLRELVLERFELREALARKIDQRPEIKEMLAAHLREVKGRQFNRNEVRAKVRPTDEEMRAYYDSHLPEFAEQERRRFVAINLNDRGKAQRAAELLRAGKSTEEVRVTVAAADTSWKSTGDAGTPLLTYGRSPLLDDVIFRLPLNGVSDPIPVGNGYTVAKVIELLPFRQKPFDEVKITIQTGMVDKRVGARLKELLDEGRKRHPVTIDWEAVDRARLRAPEGAKAAGSSG